MRHIVVVSLVLLGAACGEDETSNEVAGDIRENVTWKSGTKIAGLVRIFEGATVEIEPGARIACTEAAQIQIGGTLRVKSAARHAAIGCPRWTGLLVAANGTVDVDGLDISNADIGIETTKKAGAVQLTNVAITSTVRPFLVGPESTLNLTRVRATTPTTLRAFDVSVSEVFGRLVAKYLEYEANTNEGIMVQAGGEADIEDSTLTATRGHDLVSSYGGKSVKIRYSTLTGSHCGPHIDAARNAERTPTGSFEIDHISSEKNIFGITIYAASVSGPLIVRDSNLGGDNAWLDLQGDHGPVLFQNVFTTGGTTIANTDPPTIERATARIEDAKPR
jgi:hypothetical protein